MDRKEYIDQPLEIQKELLAFFKPDDELVIFDIGACEGEDSIRYANLFPNSKIFCFEPLKDNYSIIIENIKKYGKNNIFPFNEALSNLVGTSVFHVSSGKPAGVNENEDWDYGNKSSSLLEPAKNLKKHYTWLEFNHQHEVKTNTLKNFAMEQHLNSIDIIHLDVQGAEMMVLEGASDFLGKIKMIWMEVENLELYQGQPLKKSIESFMKSMHFYKIKDTVNKISGDQLYVNTHYFPEEKFTGKIKTLLGKLFFRYPSFKKSYAQTGEDLIIHFIFHSLKIEKPFYLDIGTYDPCNINNTYFFYRKGARGVCVEPDPCLFKRIQQKRPGDICLNAGIGLENSKNADFYIMSTKTLNTFSKQEAEKYVSFGRQKIEKIIQIPLININHLVKEYFNGPINLVSIDIEGFDEQVVRSFDFSQKRPEVFCVETINYTENNTETKNPGLIEYMQINGYMVFADTYINTIFVDEKKWKNR